MSGRVTAMADLNYEVMVRSPAAVPGMRANVWYIESAHGQFKPARERYEGFCARHPDPRLLVALVRSSYDERSRLFHDKVVLTRDERVTPVRQEAKPLQPEARDVLKRDFAKHASTAPPAPLRIRARPEPPKRRINWAVCIVLLMGVGGAVAALLVL
jgi:hypothetical protein